MTPVVIGFSLFGVVVLIIAAIVTVRNRSNKPLGPR